MKFALLIISLVCSSLILEAQDSQVFKVSQVMPRLKACKEFTDPAEIRSCMQENINAAIDKNLKYPSEAEDAGQEGIAMVNFIIRKDGSLDEISVSEDPGYGMGEAAMKAVSKTKKDWVAGSNFGNAVDVSMTVPVYFKLPESDEDAMTDKPVTPPFYVVVDEMPRFKGCGDVTADQASACTRDLSLAWINANLKYPAEAKKNNVEGEVYAEFIIDEEGKVTQAKITQGLSEETDQEVTRLLNSMPQWIPGNHQGKAVKVKMNMPFRFRMAKVDDDQ